MEPFIKYILLFTMDQTRLRCHKIVYISSTHFLRQARPRVAARMRASFLCLSHGKGNKIMPHSCISKIYLAPVFSYSLTFFSVNFTQPFRDISNCKQPFRDITNCKQSFRDIANCKQPFRDIANCKQPFRDIANCKQPFKDIFKIANSHTEKKKPSHKKSSTLLV